MSEGAPVSSSRARHVGRLPGDSRILPASEGASGTVQFEQGDPHYLARAVLERLQPGIAVEIGFREAWGYEVHPDPAAFQFNHHG